MFIKNRFHFSSKMIANRIKTGKRYRSDKTLGLLLSSLHYTLIFALFIVKRGQDAFNLRIYFQQNDLQNNNFTVLKNLLQGKKLKARGHIFLSNKCLT